MTAVPILVARRAATPPELDGRLEAPCWRDAVRSDRFVDLVSGGPTALDTRVAVVWDDEHLYVGFRLEEPDVRGRHAERDAPIWEDDDVELFVAGPDAYYELEINALNTVYEALFVWDDARRRAGYDRLPELQRPEARARAWDGVDFRHPRGGRTGYFGWDLPGLRTAVHVDGTLNDASDRDRGWSVEIALPWRGLALLTLGTSLVVPPREGDEWRIAFSRFNTDRHDGHDDSGGWALAPHGVWDSHIPERFPLVRFEGA